MSAAIRLPARLDLTAAHPLAREISAVGGDLILDCAEVTHLGGLCLQVLLAAQKDCQANGRDFRLLNRTEDLDAALKLLGAELPQSSEKVPT
ncbi:STAS domain-containing protein [Paracoccus aerodenitrificans]|uniref:STAS domain-containing protein n=1 Tax=Paracoccus aerodenitrificans TaxID=3017781 RepID=UPI0022F07AF4|nr:STAS domain-containing protein [Paracoccus aerodenitrificans]WBU62797.1 STAS domain-containing protein [Paracoccus aerodenitrificans]